MASTESPEGVIHRFATLLDASYIDKWVEQLGLRDEWLKAKTLAGKP